MSSCQQQGAAEAKMRSSSFSGQDIPPGSPCRFCWPLWTPCSGTWGAAETLVLITSSSNAQSPWVLWWFSTDKQQQGWCRTRLFVLFICAISSYFCYFWFVFGNFKSGHCSGVCAMWFLHVINPKRYVLTFSLWISFLIWEIRIFIASISSSWTRGMGVDSESSMVWKVRSASGMYHLQSYCCPFLFEDMWVIKKN